MALHFNKVTWIDRVSDYPNRRKLTEFGVDGAEPVSYIVERDDNPSVEGTPYNASTMNDLQDRIGAITIDVADFSNDGLMSAKDKQKLNGIAEGATRNSILRGSGAPSGGNDGDIYFRYS